MGDNNVLEFNSVNDLVEFLNQEDKNTATGNTCCYSIKIQVMKEGEAADNR